MMRQNKTATLTILKPDEVPNPSNFVENTYSNAPNQYTFNTNQTQSHQILHKNQSKQHKKSYITKRKKRNFTLNEDQQILLLVLNLGPKFKQIAKKIPGKSINVLKNRYYRDLRYRWDEILGEKYIHLNEKKEEANLRSLVTDQFLHQDLSDILMSMLSKIQMVIDNCLH